MSEGTGNLGSNTGYPNAFVVVMISVRQLLLVDLLTAVLMRANRNRVVTTMTTAMTMTIIEAMR
jgi:hypothetical protein